MLGWLKALFEAWTSANRVAEKALPNENIQNGKFEINKQALTEAQIRKVADKRNQLADEMFGDLVGHPELNISDKVNYEATKLDEKEKLLLIKILTDRLNASPKYNRLKNKTSKFRL